MSTILPLGLQEAQDGKGLGLFAPSHFRPGSVLFEDEALFRRYTRELILPNVKFADIYSKVMQWYGDLLEKSATKEWLEWLLFRKPSLNMLFDIAQTRSSLEMHSVEFSCLDESTKIRNLYGYLNYNDGARIMNDVNDCLLGFSVHASLLNHSCNPNAILAIHTYVDGQVQKADWSTGTIQIRALKHIGLRDEITISYDHSLRTSPQARRLFLQGAYRFRCECQMCRHETPLSRAQFSTLHNGLSSLYDMSKSRSQVYRTAHRFCRNARAVGWNDCQILDILEYARCVAVQTRDRIRAMYWASNAWNWCKIFLGEEHEKSRRYLRLYDELVVLGVPTMITEGTLDVRPLMCMIEHPDTDDTYYFLRCDDGVLSEVGESENRLLSNWASERQDSGWDEKVLKDVISMFDNPMLELAAEAAYESLLRELNAVEQVSRKKKTKKGRKKANQAADSTPNVQDRQADSSRSTTSEPPAGPPASSSISANAQMHPPNVPDQENIGFQGMSLLEDLGPFEWQQVESKKGSKKAKGKQRALEQMATNPHVDGGVARGTRSLETRVSESSLLPSASPVSINLATHDWEQVDFKEDFNKTKGKQRVAANASTMTTYSLARAHLGTLTVETGVHKCASPAGNLFTKPFTPPSSLAITPTSQKTPLSPSQVGQNAANTDPMTPPDSTEKRSANLPAPKGCLVVSPPTPVNRITAVPMPPESQTARSISPPLRPPTPQVNLPVAKDLPIHLMPPQSLPSPQIKLPVVGRAPVPSYQFVRFGTELESREGCTTSEVDTSFDSRAWYPVRAELIATVDDTTSDQDNHRSSNATPNSDPGILMATDPRRQSAWHQFRRQKISDPCDGEPTAFRGQEDLKQPGDSSLLDFMVSFTGNNIVHSRRFKETEVRNSVIQVDILPEHGPYVSVHDDIASVLEQPDTEYLDLVKQDQAGAVRVMSQPEAEPGHLEDRSTASASDQNVSEYPEPLQQSQSYTAAVKGAHKYDLRA